MPMHHTAIVRRPCPAGTNIAEKREIRKERKDTNKGPQTFSIMDGYYVVGEPFGNLLACPAPVALEVDDALEVDVTSGEVTKVTRNGGIVFRCAIITKPTNIGDDVFLPGPLRVKDPVGFSDGDKVILNGRTILSVLRGGEVIWPLVEEPVAEAGAGGKSGKGK